MLVIFQAYFHVVIEPPRLLALIAGRFRVPDGEVVNCQHIIRPDRLLQLPIFIDGEFRNTTYQLNAYVLHRGEVPTSGHYMVVVCDESGIVHLADDNVPMRTLNEMELQWFYQNAYMFFYEHVDGLHD